MPDYYSFYQLHLAIQGCFGWKDSHLFQFSKNNTLDKFCITLPDDEGRKIAIVDARLKGIVSVLIIPGDRYTYIYDFGDNWEHDIVLEDVKPKSVEQPYCLAGGGACPPEEVGVSVDINE